MTETKPKRRWFRFSLRTLFVLVTICAFVALWGDAQIRHAKRIKRATAALQPLGANIYFDYEYIDDPSKPVPYLLVNVSPAAPEWLRRIFGDEYFVEIVSVVIRSATDDLKLLEDVPNLHSLDLEKSAITDKALTHLKSLSKLRWLYLAGTKVTDQGLKELEGLKKLRCIYVYDTHVTQEGAKALRRALPNVTIFYGPDGQLREGDPLPPHNPPRPTE